MREYDDIIYRNQWISVEEVNKGWSEDKKFHYYLEYVMYHNMKKRRKSLKL